MARTPSPSATITSPGSTRAPPQTIGTFSAAGAHEHEVGTKTERQDDVRSPPDATVEHHRHLVADGGAHQRQHLDRANMMEGSQSASWGNATRAPPYEGAEAFCPSLEVEQPQAPGGDVTFDQMHRRIAPAESRQGFRFPAKVTRSCRRPAPEIPRQACSPLRRPSGLPLRAV